MEKHEFVHLAAGARHSIGITSNGDVYSWGKSNNLGQLGRSASSSTMRQNPGKLELSFQASKAFVSHGSTSDSGHSALLDTHGNLWMTGCDRWQQLGLGSSKAGSSGYTWKDGKLWHESFQLSRFVTDFSPKSSNSFKTFRTPFFSHSRNKHVNALYRRPGPEKMKKK